MLEQDHYLSGSSKKRSGGKAAEKFRERQAWVTASGEETYEQRLAAPKG